MGQALRQGAQGQEEPQEPHVSLTHRSDRQTCRARPDMELKPRSVETLSQHRLSTTVKSGDHVAVCTHRGADWQHGIVVRGELDGDRVYRIRPGTDHVSSIPLWLFVSGSESVALIRYSDDSDSARRQTVEAVRRHAATRSCKDLVARSLDGNRESYATWCRTRKSPQRHVASSRDMRFWTRLSFMQ